MNATKHTVAALVALTLAGAAGAHEEVTDAEFDAALEQYAVRLNGARTLAGACAVEFYMLRGAPGGWDACERFRAYVPKWRSARAELRALVGDVDNAKVREIELPVLTMIDLLGLVED